MKITLGLLLCITCAVFAQQNVETYDHEEYVPFIGQRFDQLDWKLIKSVMEKSNGNLVISPFSVKILLMLLAEASETGSQTFKELEAIMPNIRVPYDGREYFKKVLGSYNSTSGLMMKVGTRIYMDKDLKPRPRYKQIAKNHYETQVESVDFARAAEIAQQINKWVANATDNNIQNFVSEDDLHDIAVLMLNAVYFKGAWRNPFKPEKTVRKEFQGLNNVKAQVEFMTKTDSFYCFESNQLQSKILRLPYADSRYAMFIILPNADNNINNLIKKLDSKTIAREAWYLDEIEVKAEIPKFSIEYDADMKTHLQNVGIRDIFTNNAKLPGLFQPDENKNDDNSKKVSNILQKAGIIVNEEGSTAYAATQVQIVNKFGEQPFDFKADRPFIFFIEDEGTGTILFAGKITDPSKL